MMSIWEREYRQGYTLVEMLVVVLIVCTMALAGIFLFAKERAMERNFRREAAVRTALVQSLERIERGFSLGRECSSTSGDTFRVAFPLQTGGVSLESNRYFRVSNVSLQADGNVLLGNIACEGGRLKEANATSKVMRADTVWFQDAVAERLDGVRLESMEMDNTDLASKGLLTVRLSSSVPLEDSRGNMTKKPISVERIVRLWNWNR